jgi:hypothetical protein
MWTPATKTWSTSTHRSSTRADFARQATKMERAADAMLARHRATEARDIAALCCSDC